MGGLSGIEIAAVAALVFASLGIGCSKAPLKGVCAADDDCESHLCVAFDESRSDGMCTKSCDPHGHDCPVDWHCAGTTSQGVVICTPTPATPFGAVR